MIPGVGIGVIFAAPSPSARFAPSASWPEGRRAPAHLGEAAEQALTERRGIVLKREAGDDSAAPGRDRYDVAYPIQADGRVRLRHADREARADPSAARRSDRTGRAPGQAEPGNTAEVLPESPVGGVHPAKVTVVDRVVDAASGTFGVRLEVPNPNYRLPAGLKCKARFNR
jgi:multidrug efflux pump subunit AcrA (membrane-fusion protein)